jgi:hypothetical protein
MATVSFQLFAQFHNLLPGNYSWVWHLPPQTPPNRIYVADASPDVSPGDPFHHEVSVAITQVRRRLDTMTPNTPPVSKTAIIVYFTNPGPETIGYLEVYLGTITP